VRTFGDPALISTVVNGAPLTLARARGTVAHRGGRAMRTRVAAALLCALFLSLAARPAPAANPFEMNFWMSGPRYDGVLPPCDYSEALGRIQSRFAVKESRFWNSELHIVAFEKIRETAFRPWAAQNIPRRYCSAVAVTSDGVRRPVHYSIGEDL